MESASRYSVQPALVQQGAIQDQHSTQLSSTSHDVQILSRQLTELHTCLEQVKLAVREIRQSIPSAEAAAAPEHEPHTVNSPTYDGDVNTCQAFLSQCSLVFALQPRRYASEMSKVAFIITLLTGRARDWGAAVWDACSLCCETFETFKTELFDRSLQGDLAASELVRLSQKGLFVTDYSIVFKTLAASCTWNDAALKAQFFGLDDEIPDEISSRDLPSSLEGLIELALRIESRHRQRRHRLTSRQCLFESTPCETSHAHTLPSSSAEGKPMQLGRLCLTSREKQHRLANGLCLYCGKAGHMAISCPVKGTARR